MDPTGLKDIAQGKTDDFARNYLALIDKPNSFDPFAANLRVLQQFGAPVFMEKVVDVKYGGALREVIYLALYRRTDYVYFRFVIKKNSGGWLISDFAFKSNASISFPQISPRSSDGPPFSPIAAERQRLGRRFVGKTPTPPPFVRRMSVATEFARRGQSAKAEFDLLLRRAFAG